MIPNVEIRIDPASITTHWQLKGLGLVTWLVIATATLVADPGLLVTGIVLAPTFALVGLSLFVRVSSRAAPPPLMSEKATAQPLLSSPSQISGKSITKIAVLVQAITLMDHPVLKPLLDQIIEQAPSDEKDPPQPN